MKVAVIGAGAVGAFYGAKLQYSGAYVQFQSKTLHAAHPGRLKVKSIWGDFSVPIRCFADTKEMDTADFIIIATKVTNPEKDAPQLLGLMKPILSSSTVVLFLQNGINMEERISKHISNPILGGLAFTCINRLKPNLIHHIDYGLIKMGALRKKENSIAKEIVEVFLQSGIETVHASDLRQARYEKLLWNVPFNSLSVLCSTDTKQLIANPETKELARKLMEETRSIAKKEGKKITGKMIDEMIKKTESMKPYKTSMLIDFESKKKMEVESILGELIRLAKEYKIPVPYLETIYKLLSFYNAKI